MYMNDNKFAWLALATAAAGSTHGAPVIACEDIAIVARDGRYIVASADDLSERDVGNLWWLGIRTIDGVVPQSTLRRAGLLVELRIDPTTGEAHQSELAVLGDLGRAIPPGTPPVQTVTNDFQSAWWVDDSGESELAIAHSSPAGASITLYSSGLEMLGADLALPVPLGTGVSCRDGDRIVIGTLRHRAIIADETLALDELLSATTRDYRSLGVTPAGCTTLIGSLPDARPNVASSSTTELAARTIDLATNELGPEFRKRRSSDVALFARGTLLFEQELDAAREGDIGFRLTPTGRVRVLNVDTGSTVRSDVLPGAGKISRLFCRNDKERLVMAAEGEVYLVDLTSLTVVASRQVPFDSYFVF